MGTVEMMRKMRERAIRNYIFENPTATNTEIAKALGINRAVFSTTFKDAANAARGAYLEGEDL